MVLPSNETISATERQSDFLDFFSQAIERYKKSVKECVEEEAQEDVQPSRQLQRSPPPKKRSSSHVISDESSTDNSRKVHKISPSDVSSGSGSEDKAMEPGVDVEKKRLASRVSSRRTREREKLRMDHFRNAKLKLQQENKKLYEENDEIRTLIKKIKEEKEVLERKSSAIQSLMTQNPPAAAATPLPLQGSQGLATPALPLPQQQPYMAAPALAVMLLNALVQAQGGAPQTPPAQPTQEQQLLSLLGLVSANPALAQLLTSQAPKPQNNNNNLLAAMLQGGGMNKFGAPQDNYNHSGGAGINPHFLGLLLSGAATGGGQSNGGQSSASLQGGYMSMDSARSM